MRGGRCSPTAARLLRAVAHVALQLGLSQDFHAHTCVFRNYFQQGFPATTSLFLEIFLEISSSVKKDVCEGVATTWTTGVNARMMRSFGRFFWK